MYISDSSFKKIHFPDKFLLIIVHCDKQAHTTVILFCLQNMKKFVVITQYVTNLDI